MLAVRREVGRIRRAVRIGRGRSDDHRQLRATGRLELKYGDQVVGDLAMEFLHDGRPPVVREAIYSRPPQQPHAHSGRGQPIDSHRRCSTILGSLNVASKEWVIRQYDHEVQGGSVIKPLVGVHERRPQRCGRVAARARLRGAALVVACGMNPRYGDFDTYHMAASAIDEAVRNCVAVGADPQRIAILDNFCWGNTDRPETLGSLVRAALACYDVAVALGTPFISGKDSLNNEFRYTDARGQHAVDCHSAVAADQRLGPDRRCRRMRDDGPERGRQSAVSGRRDEERTGRFALRAGPRAARAASAARSMRTWPSATFAAVHHAIRAGLVRACHDLSEGGLAAAVAEMAFAGGLGAHVDVVKAPIWSTEKISGMWLYCFRNPIRGFSAKCPPPPPVRLPRRWPECRTLHWAK